MRAIVLLIAIGLTACRKSNSAPDRLPSETHSGLNTMGCYVNGELFIPQEPALASHSFASARLELSQPYSIWLSWNDEPQDCGSNQVDIHIDSIQGLQSGTVLGLGAPPVDPYDDSTNAQWAVYTRYPCQGTPLVYETGIPGAGNLVVTWFDPIVGIIAGTFAFDAVGPAGDTLHITQGRFDMSTR